MGLRNWFCRCIPGFAVIIWIIFCIEALHGKPQLLAEGGWQHLNFWQWGYLLYSVIAHVCACLIFPLRLCWSIWHMTYEVRNARFEASEVARTYDTDSQSSVSVDDKQSLMSLSDASLSSMSTLTPDGPLSRVGTPKFEEPPVEVYHAIILPAYKEDIETLQETISVLASHGMARTHYDLYLAMEQRDPTAEKQATSLIDQFAGSFHMISYTLHPGDIVGEVAGKSSNVSWAAQQLSHNYTDAEQRRNVIVTVMDSDTHLSASYFLLVTKMHREDEDSAISMYAPPIIFDRNSQKVNPLVRTADVFWCGGGLSGLYRGSSVKIPTSVYSVAMTLAGQVGGWDTGPESIGEDMHMFLKCYFALKGQANVKIVFSPASQCNVHTDLKGFRGIVSNVYARYNQALRHMWGSLDTGYAVEKGLEHYLSKKGSNMAWLSQAAPEERVSSWVHDSNLTHFTPPDVVEDISIPQRSFSKVNLMLLYHRLYEAHFLPTHLTIALFSAVIFTAINSPSSTHPLYLTLFSFCGTLRFIGFCLTMCYLYLYESYHAVCVRFREDEMRRANLYESMSEGFAYRKWSMNWVDYLCLPVVGALFATLPATVCYFRHFYTNNLLYVVSAKPQLKKAVDRIRELA